MGAWKFLKKVSIEGIDYFVTGGSGFPEVVTANNTFIDANNILGSSINPVKIINKKSVEEGKYTEAVYHFHPIKVVFYSLKDMETVWDISIFNEYFKNSLHCDYVLGIFNHCSGLFPNKTPYMSANKCFSVALFNKTQDEAIDFAISYIHKTNRIGALIVGKELTSATITVVNDEFRSLCKATLL